jgi:hypothetical protein
MFDPLKLKMLEEMMVFAGGMATLGCVTGVVNAWIRTRAKIATATNPSMPQQLDEIAARLAQIETATDAMAIEIERISEGQRFTTKLLADRTLPAVPGDRPRVGSTTPH